MAKKISIEKIKRNPDNPRVIKDDKFKSLVKSIMDFPEMLELRPIVVNEDRIVLGGNQRLEACREAGLTDIPYLVAKGLTPEQEKEFMIKDNTNYGEWDFKAFKGWDTEIVLDWGLEVPDWAIKETEFTPEFMPTTSVNQISKKDIEKTEQKLNTHMSSDQPDLQSVTCPHCLEDFQIKK